MSLILSSESTILFKAVSNPIELSVPKISLSIEAGTPTTGNPNSSENICPPVIEPLPPITTKASTPCDNKFL